MSVQVDELEAVVKVFTEVFNENHHFSHFVNSVSVGERNTSGQYCDVHKIRFNKVIQNLEANPSRRQERDWIRIGDVTAHARFGIIHVEKFNHQLLPIMFYGGKYKNAAARRRTRRYSYDDYDASSESDIDSFKIYTPYSLLFENGTIQSLGVRLLKNIRIRGALCGFNQVREIIAENKEKIFSKVTEFYYVGQKNILFGAAMTDGYLCIRLQALMNIIRHNSLEVSKLAVKQILTAFDKLNDVFSKLNIRDFENEIHPILTNKVYSAILQNKRMIPTDSKDAQSVNYFKKKITKIIREVTENLLQGTCFGIKDNYSYAELVEEIITARKRREKTLVEKAFAEGMQFGLKVEMLGWRPIKNPKFVTSSRSDDVSSLWWIKDVKIIPQEFIHQNRRYRIPPKYRKWHISKLYINQRGDMYCENANGKKEHPNVSGGRVCTGDLRIDFGDQESILKETLHDAEALLEIINYDSPHHPQDLVKLLEVSEELGIYDENAAAGKKFKKIKDSDSIHSLDFSGDDIDLTGEDGEEIEVEENEESVSQIIRNEEGEVLAVAVEQESENEISEREQEELEDDSDVMISYDDLARDGFFRAAIRTIRSDPSYSDETTSASTNFEFATRAEWVYETGGTSPIVRPMEERLQERPRQQEEENLMLGDANLLT